MSVVGSFMGQARGRKKSPTRLLRDVSPPRDGRSSDNLVRQGYGYAQRYNNNYDTSSYAPSTSYSTGQVAHDPHYTQYNATGPQYSTPFNTPSTHYPSHTQVHHPSHHTSNVYVHQPHQSHHSTYRRERGYSSSSSSSYTSSSSSSDDYPHHHHRRHHRRHHHPRHSMNTSYMRTDGGWDDYSRPHHGKKHKKHHRRYSTGEAPIKGILRHSPPPPPPSPERSRPLYEVIEPDGRILSLQHVGKHKKHKRGHHYRHYGNRYGTSTRRRHSHRVGTGAALYDGYEFIEEDEPIVLPSARNTFEYDFLEAYPATTATTLLTAPPPVTAVTTTPYEYEFAAFPNIPTYSSAALGTLEPAPVYVNSTSRGNIYVE
eukprot:NODE_152_length_1334_cov_316.326429_g148_i0.p1 GENE.NODE_152_length_1334_cov_316.326429_g148_i0~~NODE_152_length_1334_cov_316.326429_g148_i0.p1  ORF type:complete len:371 (+),score=82.57 NODE_152_length_1334_cov_316.326429_g148_i0:70-1182(+)